MREVQRSEFRNREGVFRGTLCRHTGYSDAIPWFSSVTPRKCLSGASFMPDISQFIGHPTIRRYVVSILKASFNNSVTQNC
jgi:hypothetical protein